MAVIGLTCKQEPSRCEEITMQRSCIHCRKIAQVGETSCSHCGQIIPAAAAVPENEPDTPLGTPLKVPSVKLKEMETRWDRRGWKVGACLGVLVLLLIVLASSSERSSGLEIFGVLLCVGPFAAFAGGAFGMFFGELVGAALRSLCGPAEADERILEIAMDRHKEIARPWSPGESQDVPPPANAETTDITRDPEGKAPEP
jgi:hypothetical protein